MNTLQINEGKPDFAIITEQKAVLFNDLNVKVYSFLSSVDSQKTIYALNTVLEHWIKTEYKSYVREGLCDEDMKLWDMVVRNVFDTISLISDLEKHVDAYHYLKEQALK